MIDRTEAEIFFEWAFPNWEQKRIVKKLQEWEDREAFPDECLGVVENSINYPQPWFKYFEEN